VIKEATATVFVFGQIEGEYRLGLVFHPRLSVWIPPGGHVEPDETTAEAALREVAEETGLEAELLPPPHQPLPPGYPYEPVPPAWWTVEIPVGPDRHTPEPHIHVDHQYVALAVGTEPRQPPAHPFEWRRAEELSGDGLIADAQGQAAALFDLLRSTGANGDRSRQTMKRSGRAGVLRVREG
jgi:8-oxo-dGTP pyrophosphatase MutT (NUDIX family)